jgi:hypothetical protein
MKYSIPNINFMTPAEFEFIREKGEEYRRELSDSVLVKLDVPQGWQINAEYRKEFGGMFPVQCRLSVDNCDEFHLCVCSPGELSPLWLVVLLSGDGSMSRTLQQADEFDPLSINQLVSKVAGMKRFNCTAKTVVTLLAGEVAA